MDFRSFNNAFLYGSFKPRQEEPATEDDGIRSIMGQSRDLWDQLPGKNESIEDPSEEEIADIGTVIVFLPQTDRSSLIEKVQEVRPDDGRAAFLECAKSFRKRAQEGLPILEDSIEYILAPILGLNRDALIEEVRLGIRQGKIRTRDGLDEPGEAGEN